ncbi:PKD-like family lipoprotein [uncultured Chitinophaga sp.]|uniref:PKD-like family lipoprotein n=1 Tax=uncultured Chitinophaga sp. TaxID=339340 RepID=UPI0025E90601|nr:PKD-like family lipoprotein [uncultured Chitinophaga sp.]
MTFQWFKYICCLTLFASLFTACKKDLGNYTYKDINTLTIKNIPDTLSLINGQAVNIEPGLDFTQDTVAGNYSFEWVSYDPRLADVYTKKVLADTRDLKMTLPLGIGNYNVYYTVKEKSTGITWQKKILVIITGTIKRRGWFVLSDVSDKAKLDYFEEDMAAPGTFLVEYRNFIARVLDKVTATPMSLQGKPTFIEVFSNTVAGVTGAKQWLYIGTENSGEKINITDGFTWENPLYSIKAETATGTYPATPSWVRGLSTQGYAYQEGNLFFSYPVLRAVWGVPVNRLSTGEPFSIAPHIAMSTGGVSLVFDRNNKRFLKHNASNFMTTLTPKRFDPNNMNKDLVWMGHTSAFGGQAIAILKDAADKRYLARMQFTTSGTFAADSLKEVTLTDLAGAENFIMDNQFGYFLYSKGGKLYRYNLDTEELILIKDYGASAQITLLKNRVGSFAQWFQVEARPDIYNKVQLEPLILGITVGVFEPANPATSGKLDVIKISGSAASSYYTLTGFGKVVDAGYTNLN